MPKFNLNGKSYNIPDNLVDQFLIDNPTAEAIEEVGKLTPSQEEKPGVLAEEIAAPVSPVGESVSEDTSLDLQKPSDDGGFADLEFTNSLLDPSVDKFEVIKNRYFIGTADVIKGAEALAKEEAKENQISNLNKKFKEGEFKKDEKVAFLDFQKTGKINPDLLPDTYIRKINPKTLEPYTGEEILNNVYENFLPGLKSQLEAGKAAAIDWISKAAGPDAADFIVNPKLGAEGIKKENNKYYYELQDGSKQEIGVESTKKQKRYIDNYIKLQDSMQYAGDIVEGFEKGDMAATVGGIANAVSGAVQTIVPALATRGASIYPQVAGPMILDYNIEKANTLYPDDPNAINRLVDNKQWEFGVPAAAAVFSASLEKVGIKGVREAMNANKGFANSLIKTLWATGGEGATGFGQFLTEETSLELAKGKTLAEALQSTSTKVFSKDALEATLQEAFGGGVFSVAGRGFNRTRKVLSALRAPVDIQAIEKDIEELSKLKIQYTQATDKIVSDGIQQKINDVESRLSSRVVKGNAIVTKLNDKELDEIENLNDLAEKQISRVKDLNQKFDKKEITEADYKTALEGFKATYISAKNRIKGITDEVQTRPEQVVAEEIDTQEQVAPLSKAEQAVQKIIAKEKVASSKVQQIYNDKGIDGINEIFREFKPIVDRIVDKRRDAPNFDRELLTSEIQIGKRGILDLVRAYPKYVAKQEAANQPVAPLAGFINKQLPNRAIEASRRILGEEFTQDVTEAKAVTATETAEDIVTQQEQVKAAVKTELAKDLNLSEETQNEVLQAVEKTLGTKLPSVTDKKFKQELVVNFRNELSNTFKDIFGKTAAYEQFLRDNFEKIYPSIPQEVINRSFKEFNEPVLDPRTGKQAREKTAEGKKVFKKKDITKAEFVKYFLDAPGNVKGARKTTLANTLAGEIGLDNVLKALSKPEVVERFKGVQEIQGQEVPANFIEIISQQIDRAISYLDNLQKNNQNLYVSLGIPELSIAAAKAFLKAAKATLKLTNDFAKALKAGIKAAQDLFETKEEKLIVKEKFGNIYKKAEDLGDITKIETATEDVDNGVVKIRTFNVLNNSISDLKNNIKLAKTIEEKETAIYDFLKYELSGIAKLKLGKEGYIFNEKSAAIKHAWAWFNEQNVFDKQTIKNFKLAESGKFGGQGIFYKNIALNNFEGKYRPSQNSIVLGKSGWKSFYNTLVKQKPAQDNMNEDYSNYLANKIAKLISEGNEKGVDEYLQIMGAASDSALRFAGKIRSVEKGKPGDKLVYEHTPPIKVLRSNIKKAIDENKSKEENYVLVKNELNKSFVDFITEKNTKKLNESGLKEKGTFPKRYDGILNVEKDLEYLINQKNSPKEDATLSEDFNKIIENKTGIAADKVYKKAKAEVVGASKGKWKFFIPPSAEDFVGLLYATLGKGKLGDQQMAWYKYNLLNPYTDALNNITRDRVELAANFKAIKKQLKIVPKNLRKKVPGTQYSQQDAVRVYIWNKQGIDLTEDKYGLDNSDLKTLLDFVNNDSNLVTFADQLIAINKEDGYAAPGDKWWNAGSIDLDLLKGLNTTKRAKYLKESGWTDNIEAVFSEGNLNKLEAAYGRSYRLALENIIKRMKTGRNRTPGADPLTERFTDWISNSIGNIMFLNSRSAILQTISAVNFINWSDNNVLAAGKALLNAKQYSKDFMTLMNSPFLIERRNGLKIDVNESEIADLAATSKNKAKAIIGKLLKAGFLPTQIADSFAIASGGAAFYRNRINSLVKAGYKESEAETIAMRDFRELATESQQSSDPSRISQQQAGPLGRIVLAFANTPAQYARLTKKAVLDIKNGRGDLKTNISKIIYYTFVQNIIFTALQQALFAVAFGDDEEKDDEMNEKYIRMGNSMADGFLRGLGFAGAAVSVAKNVAIKIAEESEKKSPKFEEAAWKLLEISPPISSKISKFRSAGRQISWNRKEIKQMGMDLKSPAMMPAAQVIAGTTNVPIDRLLRKIDNVQNALSEDTAAWQKVALLSGWSDWELGIKEEKKKKAKIVKPTKISTGINKSKIKTGIK